MPKLLWAIHQANEKGLRVIVGIGHCDDKPLCNRAAFFDAGTPSGVAHYILNELHRQETEDEKAILKKQVDDLRNEVKHLQEEKDKTTTVLHKIQKQLQSLKEVLNS